GVEPAALLIREQGAGQRVPGGRLLPGGGADDRLQQALPLRVAVVGHARPVTHSTVMRSAAGGDAGVQPPPLWAPRAAGCGPRTGRRRRARAGTRPATRRHRPASAWGPVRRGTPRPAGPGGCRDRADPSPPDPSAPPRPVRRPRGAHTRPSGRAT